MRACACAAALGLLVALGSDARGEPVRILAHRGVTLAAAENSLAACVAAFALDVACEVDVRSTRDGALVLMHDAAVSRTTEGRGRVAALTLAELRGFRLRGTPSERVPALEELLALARAGDSLLLDLKQADEAFHARLVQRLRAAAPRAQIELGVRSAAQARGLRAALAEFAQVALIERPREIESFAAAGAATIRLELSWLERDAALAERVRATGARLLVWAPGREAGALRAALAYAPDALLCDEPAAALALQRNRAP